MLQLHRTLHPSTSVSLGPLTTAPSWPSMPNQERSLQGVFSTVLLRMAVPVIHPLSPPTSPHPIVGWLPCALSRFIPTPSGMLARPTWGAQALAVFYHITNICTSEREGASSHASRLWVSAPKIS